MAKLKTHVHVHDDEHGTVLFEAGTDRADLPEWAKAKIGAHAFDDPGATPEDDEVDSTDGPAEPVDLDSMKRAELDDYAATVGVVEPEKLPNIQAVKDAIAASTATPEAGNG